MLAPVSDREQAIVEHYLRAYRAGAFPMAEPLRSDGRTTGRTAPDDAPVGNVDWFIADPRAVIDLRASPSAPQDLAGFHVPRSLDRKLRRGHPFRITSDRAFERVIRACAEPAPGREHSWIDGSIIHAYILLHRRGLAHSVEAWLDGPSPADPPRLVGGVYGLALGGVFCAESMFSRPAEGGTDASKIALTYLARHLIVLGFDLLDVQLGNHHTARFGVIEIPVSEYRSRLARSADRRIGWTDIVPTWSAPAQNPDNRRGSR